MQVSKHTVPSNLLTLWLKTALLVETQSHWRGKQSLRTNLQDKWHNFIQIYRLKLTPYLLQL